MPSIGGQLAYGAGLAPGALVTPSIRLTRLLGHGGMGSVWVAEHLRLRTDVVVKFMAPEYAVSDEAMQRFEREATLAAQAKSPNVVQVFDHGISDFGLPYIAMELLVGEDLAHRIERQGHVRPAEFAGWLRQACSGLGRAHQKGIVHRDIKPENLFLCDEDGEVLLKILDFGIAKSEHATSDFAGTRTGALMGTAYYMSPEQTIGAKHIDWRADLWALGVVTYYAITGTRPFEGDAIGALVIAITHAPIPPPSTRRPELPAELDAFMRKALARAPEERFQSARELADAFAAAVAAGVDPRARGELQTLLAPHTSGSESSARPTPSFTPPPSASPSAAPARSALEGSTMAPSVRGQEANGATADRSAPRRGRTGLWVALALALGGAVALGAVAYSRTGAPTTSSEPLPPSAAVTAAPPSVAPSVPSPSSVPSDRAPPAASVVVLPLSPGTATSAPSTAPPAAPRVTAAHRAKSPPSPAHSPASAPRATEAPPAPKPSPSEPKAAPAAAKKNPLQMNFE